MRNSSCSRALIGTVLHDSFLILYHRAINVVHLLTNTNWGDGVPPTRFMSCRQSAPARERLTAVGDMSSGVHLSSDISHSQENIHVDAVKYARAQSLLSWMRDHKISVEMRVINGRIVPMVDLLPSSNRNVMRSVCSISLDGNEPKLQLNSLMRTFIENALSLSVVVDGPISIAREHALSNISVEDEVLHAQRCALDFAVIRKLQDEAAAPCQNGFRWLKTGVSKHTSNFSASFVIVSEETLCPVNITVGFGPSAGNQSVSICQRLRQRVLEECTSSNIDTVPLSDVLLRGVIALLLGRS